MEPQTAETSTATAVFRLLFPSSKAGSLIGKLGSVPGAKVQFDYPTHGDECVVVVLADPAPQSPSSQSPDGSPAQLALVRVFRRMADEVGEPEKGNGSGCCCRLLVGSGQLGRGGKVVEKVRQESGAQVRVFARDQIPACASAGDELIQITGEFSTVKKALLSISGCLLENSKVDAANSSATKVSGGSIHGTGMPAQVDPVPHRGLGSQRMAMEEEVVFKLLCHHDKVGSLIGKGGSIVRTFQNETGASIKIVDAAPDSDERVVVISAQENLEQNFSPAQEAVMRVHHRIAEIGFEPGAAVVARLLVHPQQIGCLLGKGGFIINEMRRATGASIRIFPKEQVHKFSYHHDDVVQVIGSFQSVQDALFHVTSRIREAILPGKQTYPNFGAPPHMSSFPEMPPPSFRPRHNPTSPGAYPSPVGFHHGMDRSFRSQPPDHQSPFSHGDHGGLSHMDRVPHSYGGERPGPGPAFEKSSPRAWTGDASLGVAPRSGSLRSGSQPPQLTSTSIEIMIPQAFMSHVYGENNSNLNQIRQVSGANIVIHDSKPGSLETQVVVSGTPDKTHAAQSLIHGFILCGQTQV
ncbi:KH domain-containing protein HEN4 [Argentina anserina]|uniref:KH domain-containing protein HEN4 n=1 Tax=Argentina anserina TaxID=57926 RepID=UPI00217621D4|nr:KH domain-containing protein HEN4 [Potentilla anserina]